MQNHSEEVLCSVREGKLVPLVNFPRFRAPPKRDGIVKAVDVEGNGAIKVGSSPLLRPEESFSKFQHMHKVIARPLQLRRWA